MKFSKGSPGIFQSTPSAWRETENTRFNLTRIIFQSTPSAWRETGMAVPATLTSVISIHSLRMEGDLSRLLMDCVMSIFQSTPSAWRETPPICPDLPPSRISIHSLRMEGDSPCQTTNPTGALFQSTPSAWRETQGGTSFPQAGSDFNPLPPHGGRPLTWAYIKLTAYFNPLPPHGGRQHQHIKNTKNRNNISIHSLRMEGDSKTAQESVFHFAYPCTILQKRMQKTTFCTRKNGFFRKKGEKFGAKPSASFCAPMIRTDTFPLNFSHRISGSSMSMVSFAPICSTFD